MEKAVRGISQVGLDTGH